MENYDEHTEASRKQQHELEEGRSQNQPKQNDQQSFPADGPISNPERPEHEDLNDNNAENSEQNSGVGYGSVSPSEGVPSTPPQNVPGEDAADVGAAEQYTSEEDDQEDLENDTPQNEEEDDLDERESSLS